MIKRIEFPDPHRDADVAVCLRQRESLLHALWAHEAVVPGALVAARAVAVHVAVLPVRALVERDVGV